eukprot:8253466-Heterocapsa_arctica.AAC.1
MSSNKSTNLRLQTEGRRCARRMASSICSRLGHHPRPDARVRRTDPGAGRPERDQDRLLADRLRE